MGGPLCSGTGGRIPPEYAHIADLIQELAETTGLPRHQVTRLVTEMALKPALAAVRPNEALQKAYLKKFKGQNRQKAIDVLELGRASYRLRDDDNISLAKINRELVRAEQEGQTRIDKGTGSVLKHLLGVNQTKESAQALPGTKEPFIEGQKVKMGNLKFRQLQGQPASPGLATATARVIRSNKDLEVFCAGEILVCDAIDPAMTFVVPLAAGIIERRGGMLIHGAIIAREYRIPCVTGIAGATSIIENGDRITLDGYLGIVFFSASSGRVSPAGRNSLKRRDLDDMPG